MAAGETHPYNFREQIPTETRLLIVGTAPPPRFSNPALCGEQRGLDFDFYYGSEDNYLWQFLEEIAEDDDHSKLFTDGVSSEDCCVAVRNFLESKQIWMRDVLQTYQRKPGRECSASDADIVPKAFVDFRLVFEEASRLASMVFTSEQAGKWTFEALRNQDLISNGQYREFQENYTRWKSIRVSELSRENSIEQKFEHPILVINVEHRRTGFYFLPSPTGRSRMGLKIKDKKAIYRNVLFRR